MVEFEELSDLPQFTIDFICQRAGVLPVTLRAWERRYAVVTPARTAGNYRMYTEKDVELVRWMKMCTDSGTPAGAVALELAALRKAGQWPTLMPYRPPPTAASANRTHTAALSKKLWRTLIAGADEQSTLLLKLGRTSYDMSELCQEVIVPALVEIGRAWYAGEIRVTQEHHASMFLRAWLDHIYSALPVNRGAPRIIVGGAPRERHELGPLMLALLLRRRGYFVDFVGADVVLDDLVAYARRLPTRLVCLAATMEESARCLHSMHAKLATLRPKPLFGFGGAVFNLQPALRASTSGIFLGQSLTEVCSTIQRLFPI